jgi:hypothetical protein
MSDSRNLFFAELSQDRTHPPTTHQTMPVFFGGLTTHFGKHLFEECIGVLGRVRVVCCVSVVCRGGVGSVFGVTRSWPVAGVPRLSSHTSSLKPLLVTTNTSPSQRPTE